MSYRVHKLQLHAVCCQGTLNNFQIKLVLAIVYNFRTYQSFEMKSPHLE